MKVKRFYILFMCILLMCTTTISIFADEVSNNCIESTIGSTGKPNIQFAMNLELPYISWSTPLETYTRVYGIQLNGVSSYEGMYFSFYGNSVLPSMQLVYLGDDGNYHNEGILTKSSANGIYFYQPTFDYTTSTIEISSMLDSLGITYNVVDGNKYVPTNTFTVCQYYIERSPEFMAVITAILSVFTAIGDWFVEIIPTVLTVFWSPGVDGGDGSLTIIGALSCAALAISVILLILRWVVDFFKFRG